MRLDRPGGGSGGAFADTVGAQFAHITFSATTQTGSNVPVTGVVRRVSVKIITPFNNSATLVIKTTDLSATLLSLAAAQTGVAEEYEAPQQTGWGATLGLADIVLTGSPTVGEARLILEFVDQGA
jgi:hypothetical protein